MRITDMNDEIVNRLATVFGEDAEVSIDVPGFPAIGCLGDVLRAIEDVLSEGEYVLYQP